MREIKKTVYKFEELSDKAKQKALSDCTYFNVNDSFWYEHIEQEIKEIGLELEEFDTYRREIKLTSVSALSETAQVIKSEWGKDTTIYKEASAFLLSYKNLAQLLDSSPSEIEEEDTEDRIEALEEEFLKELEHYFINSLVDGYEYLTSDEAIIETIEANEYEFYETGELYG